MRLINRDKDRWNTGNTGGGFTLTGTAGGKQKLSSIRKESTKPSGKRK